MKYIWFLYSDLYYNLNEVYQNKGPVYSTSIASNFLSDNTYFLLKS